MRTAFIPLLCILTRNRFERELEALRKELAEINNRSGRTSPPLTDVESVSSTPFMDHKALPTVDESAETDNNAPEDRKDQ